MCVYSQLTGNLTCVNDITGQEYINCNGYSVKGKAITILCSTGSPEVSHPSFRASSTYVTRTSARGYYGVGAAIARAGFGRPVYPLWPLPFTNMWGRNGMEIHGDSRSHPGRASNGCMIMSREVSRKDSPRRDVAGHLVVVAL